MILIDLLWTEIDAPGSQQIWFILMTFVIVYVWLVCLSSKISDEQKTN